MDTKTPATPAYKIVYDDSADRHAARRMNRPATQENLAARIAELIARGCIIVEVRRA